MYIGQKRSAEKTLGLWVVTLGLYGIYWISQNLEEIRLNRGKGMSGRVYTLIAIFFPPLAVSACWLLPSTVGKLYTDNGKFEQINSCWGAMLFLPSVALWMVAAMLMLIVNTGGSHSLVGDNQNIAIAVIVIGAVLINLFLLYNWMRKIQEQINNFWDEARLGSTTA
jgi:hypothetical protein